MANLSSGENCVTKKATWKADAFNSHSLIHVVNVDHLHMNTQIMYIDCVDKTFNLLLPGSLYAKTNDNNNTVGENAIFCNVLCLLFSSGPQRTLVPYNMILQDPINDAAPSFLGTKVALKDNIRDLHLNIYLLWQYQQCCVYYQYLETKTRKSYQLNNGTKWNDELVPCHIYSDENICI